MNRISYRFFAVVVIWISLSSLIVRHDIPDEKFIELAKDYPQICHFQMGEGTLIRSNWILTAAHVATALQEDREKGRTDKVICGGKAYEVDQIFVHPDYELLRSVISHDISLVKIKQMVDDIEPAKLYNGEDEVGKLITLVGAGDWGNGETGTQGWDQVTRAATNRIDFGNDQWIFFSFDSPDSGKATEYEGVSGGGDSGGPAFVKIDGVNYLAGVSSHQKGHGQFRQGHYGVKEYYARVSSYLDWIEGIVD